MGVTSEVAGLVKVMWNKIEPIVKQYNNQNRKLTAVFDLDDTLIVRVSLSGGKSKYMVIPCMIELLKNLQDYGVICIVATARYSYLYDETRRTMNSLSPYLQKCYLYCLPTDYVGLSIESLDKDTDSGYDSPDTRRMMEVSIYKKAARLLANTYGHLICACGDQLWDIKMAEWALNARTDRDMVDETGFDEHEYSLIEGRFFDEPALVSLKLPHGGFSKVMAEEALKPSSIYNKRYSETATKVPSVPVNLLLCNIMDAIKYQPYSGKDDYKWPWDSRNFGILTCPNYEELTLSAVDQKILSRTLNKPLLAWGSKAPSSPYAIVCTIAAHIRHVRGTPDDCDAYFKTALLLYTGMNPQDVDVSLETLQEWRKRNKGQE